MYRFPGGTTEPMYWWQWEQPPANYQPNYNFQYYWWQSCPHCGAMIAWWGDFCPKCGKRIVDPPPQDRLEEIKKLLEEVGKKLDLLQDNKTRGEK